MITRNAAQCVRCGDTIESKHRHDFQSCNCGAIFVDGGLEYVRRGGNPEDFRDLSSGERYPVRNDGSGSVSDGYERAHDPLCEWSTPCVHGENRKHSRDTENLAFPDATYCWMYGADCLCDLIAKVREDERANVTAEWMSNHGDRWEYGQGQRDMLAKCIAAVEAAPISGGMRDPLTGEQRVEMFIDDALAALRALLPNEEELRKNGGSDESASAADSQIMGSRPGWWR